MPASSAPASATQIILQNKPYINYLPYHCSTFGLCRPMSSFKSVIQMTQFCKFYNSGQSWFRQFYPHSTIQNQAIKSAQTQYRHTNYFLSYPFFSA